MSRPTDPSADTTQGVFELQEHRDPLFDSIASRNRALLDFRSLGPLDLVQTLRVNRDPGSCGLKHQDDHPVTNIPVSQQPIGLRQHKKTWHAVVGCCSCSSAGGTEADFPAAGTAGGTTGETAVWEGYLKPYLLAQEKPNVMQSIGAAVGLRNHWWVERVIFCMWNALEKTDLRVVYEDGMIASYGLRVPVSPPMEAEGAGTTSTSSIAPKEENIVRYVVRINMLCTCVGNGTRGGQGARLWGRGGAGTSWKRGTGNELRSHGQVFPRLYSPRIRVPIQLGERTFFLERVENPSEELWLGAELCSMLRALAASRGAWALANLAKIPSNIHVLASLTKETVLQKFAMNFLERWREFPGELHSALWDLVSGFFRGQRRLVFSTRLMEGVMLMQEAGNGLEGTAHGAPDRTMDHSSASASEEEQDLRISLREQLRLHIAQNMLVSNKFSVRGTLGYLVAELKRESFGRKKRSKDLSILQDLQAQLLLQFRDHRCMEAPDERDVRRAAGLVMTGGEGDDVAASEATSVTVSPAESPVKNSNSQNIGGKKTTLEGNDSRPEPPTTTTPRPLHSLTFSELRERVNDML